MSVELGVFGLEQQLLAQSGLAAGIGAQQSSFRPVSGVSRPMQFCGAWLLVGLPQHMSWQGIFSRDEPVKHDSLSLLDVAITGSSRSVPLLGASLARLGLSWSGSGAQRGSGSDGVPVEGAQQPDAQAMPENV